MQTCASSPRSSQAATQQSHTAEPQKQLLSGKLHGVKYAEKIEKGTHPGDLMVLEKTQELWGPGRSLSPRKHGHSSQSYAGSGPRRTKPGAPGIRDTCSQ